MVSSPDMTLLELKHSIEQSFMKAGFEAADVEALYIVCEAAGIPDREFALHAHDALSFETEKKAEAFLARRLANETGCTCGHEIGYQVRFDERTDDATVVKFMTDGILLAETQNDPKLYQYDCIILDEVHERSLNIAF